MADEESGKIFVKISQKFLLLGLVFVAVLVSTVALVSANAATAPTIVTYQGKVLANGVSATTTLNMKFVLYDALSGGNPLYSLSGSTSSPAAVSITPSSGLFTVDLGGSGYNSLDPQIFKNYGSVYLEITIGSETLTPRKQIGASPYAFNAKYLDGVAPSSTSPASQHIVMTDANGNVDLNSVTSTGLTVSGNSSLATTTISSSTISTANVGNLNISGTVSGLASTQLSDTSNLVRITANNTFTGLNIFSNTTTLATTTVSYLSATGGSLSGMTGNISMWTNNVGYLTTSTGLTISNFASPNISQWTNNVGYLTSYTETDPIWMAASSSYAKLSLNNTFTGANIFATSTFSVFQLGTSATSGYVLTTDANGYGTWQVASGGLSGGLAGTLPYWTSGSAISTTTLYWDNTNGRLGIGTSTPTSTLDVVGDVNFSGNLYKGSSKLLSFTGSEGGLAIGIGAGHSATGAGVYLGQNAGSSNPTGFNNMFIGSSAGSNTISGSKNIFIGNTSGGANTSGSDNVYVGQWTNTVGNGSYNVFLGSEAGYANTGSGNVLIGYRAGYSATSSNSLYIANSNTSSPLIYGEFDNQLVRINGSQQITGNLFVTGTLQVMSTSTLVTTTASQLTVSNLSSGSVVFADVSGLLSSTTSLYWDNTNGRLGIGTNTPQYALDVNGNINLGTSNYLTFGGVRILSVSSTGYNTYLGSSAGAANTSGSYNTFLGSSAGLSNTSGAENVFVGQGAGQSNNTGGSNVFVGVQAGNVNSSGGANTFVGSYAGYSNSTGSSNVFVGSGTGQNNTNSGNTFLGLNAGNQNLSGGYNVFLGFEAGKNETGSNKLYISNSNTASPLVYGEFDNNLARINGNFDVTGTSTFTTTSQSSFRLGTSASSGYVLTTDANGYGTWQVASGGSLSGGATNTISYWTSPTSLSTTSLYWDNTNGRLGVNVQSPGSALSVAGDINMTGVLRLNASPVATFTSGKTYLGYQAGATNTATYGTFIGANAGAANTTANYNTFIGYNAGIHVTANESYNTFVGHEAGAYSSGGINNSENVFIGYRAAYSNDSANVVAVGSQAGGTGGSATYVGYYSGRNDTGSSNVMLGALSGQRHLSGDGNIFLGTEAGGGSSYQSASDNNVIIGFRSAYALTNNADDNVVIGSSVASSLTTGYRNLLIGTDAGDAITTGIGNVMLGYQAGFGETGSNKLYIDNSNTSTPLIYGDFSNNYLAFRNKVSVNNGTSTPSYNLDVNGSFRANPIGGTSGFMVENVGGYLVASLKDGNAQPKLTFGSGAGTATIETQNNLGLNLDVLGSSDFKIRTAGSGGAATDRFVVTSYVDTASAYFANSNLGIGTTTPLEKLHVNGGNILHTASGNPTLKGSYDTSGSAYNVYVSGKYAYVADGASGLQIIDISSPASPTLVGTYNTAGSAYGVHVSGKYAYVADFTSGLQIIDIFNPASPILVSTYSTYAAFGVYVSGKYAYIADFSDGLKIVDISNPSSPTLKGSYNTSGYAYGVYVSGKYAYVADETGGLVTVDVSDPANPGLLSAYTSTAALNVYVSGKYAYVADGTAGLKVLNISDPTTSTLVGSYNTTGSAWGVYVSGKYAYVADYDSGLSVFDISDPANPNYIGVYDTSGNAKRVYIAGKYAYVADGASGLQVVDINGVETPSMYAGNVQSNDLTITENVDIGNNLSVRGGLNVGESGVMINGNFGMSGNTTNTLSFSTTTLFNNFVTGTAANAFIFNAANFASATSTYILSLRSNNTPVFSVSAGGEVRALGNLYANSATVGTPGAPGDLAERVDIAADDVVEPGDVMMVDPLSPDTYRRTNSSYEQAVAGVISTNPTIIVGNGKTQHTGVMAMVGRVPVKVSNENGSISRGDLLVSASLPGYAMRYDPSKDDGQRIVGIIGVALEPMNASSTGKIMSLVRTGWANSRAETINSLQNNIQQLASVQGVSLDNNSANLNVENQNGSIGYTGGNLNLQGNLILNVKAVGGLNDKWAIDIDGRFITRISTSNGDKEMYALQSPTVEFVFSSSSQLVSGEATITFDQMTQDIVDPNQPLKVSVTLTSGEASGIYVSEKSVNGFRVKELGSGHSNATFDWMVVAKRRMGIDPPTTEVTTPPVDTVPVTPPADVIPPPSDTTPPAVEATTPVIDTTPPTTEVTTPPVDTVPVTPPADVIPPPSDTTPPTVETPSAADAASPSTDVAPAAPPAEPTP